MKELKGRTIKAVYLSNDGEHSIAFSTDWGYYVFDTSGDCCSTTWFSDIIGYSALINSEITAVSPSEFSEYNVEDGRCRQEYDAVYGYKLTTSKGYCDIVFRNSSNGYYGGECRFDKIYNEASIDIKNWKEITNDYPC